MTKIRTVANIVNFTEKVTKDGSTVEVKVQIPSIKLIGQREALSELMRDQAVIILEPNQIDLLDGSESRGDCR